MVEGALMRKSEGSGKLVKAIGWLRTRRGGCAEEGVCRLCWGLCSLLPPPYPLLRRLLSRPPPPLATSKPTTTPPFAPARRDACGYHLGFGVLLGVPKSFLYSRALPIVDEDGRWRRWVKVKGTHSEVSSCLFLEERIN
jgi:hypothetical protein